MVQLALAREYYRAHDFVLDWDYESISRETKWCAAHCGGFKAGYCRRHRCGPARQILAKTDPSDLQATRAALL